jgi:hypothetical protein
VTGASGFAGRAVVPALAAAGCDARAAARGLPAFARPLEAASHGDLGSVDWPRLLDGVDAVVHLAGIAHTGPSVTAAEYDSKRVHESFQRIATESQRLPLPAPTANPEVADPSTVEPGRRLNVAPEAATATHVPPLQQAKARGPGTACCRCLCGIEAWPMATITGRRLQKRDMRGAADAREPDQAIGRCQALPVTP